MRTTFVTELYKRMKLDKNIILLTGDLGFGVLKDIINELPDQFINCGIAEQNMLTVAAGLSHMGKTVFVYSIGNFPTLRAVEQIRNDICYPNNNVKIICIGGGYTYGTLGMSHHAIEDISILRSLPNMHIFTPSDKKESKLTLEAVLDNKGPCYIRLERDSSYILNNNVTSLDIPNSVTNNHSDTLLLSYGTISKEVYDIVNEYHLDLVTTPRLKPINEKEYISLLSKYKNVITIEEHSIIGGLGDIIASLLATNNIRVNFHKVGIKDSYIDIVGTQEVLRKDNGLDKDSIVSFLKKHVII